MDTDEEIDILSQTLNQKKTMLAQHVLAPVIIELIRDCAEKVPLVGNNEWETVKNAITMDTTSNLMRRVVEYLEEIKQGSLTGK